MTTPAINDEADALAFLTAVIGDLGIPITGAVRLDADLRQDLGVDSVDVLDVLFEVNERLGIEIGVDDVRGRPDPTRVATVVALLLAALSRGSR